MTINDKPNNSRSEWLNGIEGQDARQLIESQSSVIRVVAGPGSGKTTCLKRRIQKLVQKDNIDLQKVFVGTFTRAISNELRDALDKSVKVSTIHSLAYTLLKDYPLACQGMQLRFLLKFEETVLLYDVKNTLSYPDTIHDLRKLLSNLQASRAHLTDYSNAQFDGAIRRWLQNHRAMLIGEVVYLCVTGLESQDIPTGIFDYVVIDEYQDLTVAEQELVRFIWSNHGSLMVMGDDDQSIYGFRFNHPQGIEDFNKKWPDCEDLTFDNNYRCGSNILDIANLMMAEAPSKKPPMIPKSKCLGQLHSVYWNTLDCEIAGLAKYIRNHNKESFLVLVPRRFIGYRLADAIGSDSKTAFFEESLEHPIAQESFTLASLLADPNDFVAVRTYLGFHGTNHSHAPERNATAYSKISSHARGIDLICGIADGSIPVSGSGKNNIKKRADTAANFIKLTLSPQEVIDRLFDPKLANDECDDEKRRWLADALQYLHDASCELLSKSNNPSLSEILSILRYRIATRTSLLDSEPQEFRVKIMTLHSAKGLEADNVVIAGVVDQFMPGISADDQDAVEEQRRLLYVAITRAKNNLIISWSRKISLADMKQNMGAQTQITTLNDTRFACTSRSRLLPKGLHNVIDGNCLL